MQRLERYSGSGILQRVLYLHGSYELLEAPGVGAALETPGVGVTTAGPAGAGPAGSGSAVAGDAPGAQSVALSAQDRVKDRELKAHMLLCVDSQFKELVAGAATAKEAWIAIEQCFKGEARARKRETATKWASTAARNGEGAQRDGEKVYEYAQRVKGVAKIWREQVTRGMRALW